MTAQIRNCSCLRGGIALEFAIALPILMLLIQGIIGLGSALHEYAVLSEAVRVAARAAASERDASDICAFAEQTFAATLAQHRIDPAQYDLQHRTLRKLVLAPDNYEWFYLFAARRKPGASLLLSELPLLRFQSQSVFVFEERSMSSQSCLTAISEGG